MLLSVSSNTSMSTREEYEASRTSEMQDHHSTNEGGRGNLSVARSGLHISILQHTSTDHLNDYQHVVSLQLLTQPFTQLCLSSATSMTQEPNFLPTLTTGTIAAKSITCSPFCSEQLISNYSYSRGCGFELFFQLQLQLQAGSLHGIIFQFRSQPRSRYGERP